jgi:hypothetical protein
MKPGYYENANDTKTSNFLFETEFAPWLTPLFV